ncbi:hypothetical protein LINPERPRIM_LOCUS29656 [Linum perenne]
MDFDYTLELMQNKYKCMVIGPLEQTDWESVRNLLPYLQFFHDLMVLASGSSYVTAHVFLGELINVSLHIREMGESGDEDVRRMVVKMLHKVIKCLCERDGDNSRLNKLCYLAVVLDPRHKLDFPKYTFNELYSKERGDQLLKELIEDLEELFAYYDGRHHTTNEVPQQMSPPTTSIPHIPTTTFQNTTSSRSQF